MRKIISFWNIITIRELIFNIEINICSKYVTVLDRYNKN